MFFDDEDDQQPRDFGEDQQMEIDTDARAIVQHQAQEADDEEEISAELWQVVVSFGDNDENDKLNQEACWVVISAYFDEKGLVRQQLDRFYLMLKREMKINPKLNC